METNPGWHVMCTWIETLKAISEIVTAAAALIAGLWAARTYHQSTKLDHAKWIKELYEKFYEDNRLKRIRDLVDSKDHTEIAWEVGRVTSEFTDYLNFFEFIGYLHDSGQIKLKEIRDLFDYYLRNLRDDSDVKKYIDEPSNGFEKLRKLLSQRR